MSCGDIFLGLLAILFPPIAVWVKQGLCSADSLINILLCCLGYLPGLIHAWYIIARYPEDDLGYEAIPEDGSRRGGHVTYYYVARDSGAAPTTGAPDAGRAQREAQRGSSAAYGTTESAGEGAASGAAKPPPTYAEAVKADNKVQTA